MAKQKQQSGKKRPQDETAEAEKENQHPKLRMAGFAAGIALFTAVTGAVISGGEAFTPMVQWVAGWWEGLPSQKAQKYDKTSPETTKCVDDAEEWRTFRFSQPGAALDPTTIMRVNGSESCSTAWVYAENSLDGTRVNKTVERVEANGLRGEQASTPDDLTDDPLTVVNGREVIGLKGLSYTDQVYAPDCVYVSLELSDVATGKVIWVVPRQEVCKP